MPVARFGADVLIADVRVAICALFMCRCPTLGVK